RRGNLEHPLIVRTGLLALATTGVEGRKLRREPDGGWGHGEAVEQRPLRRHIVSPGDLHPSERAHEPSGLRVLLGSLRKELLGLLLLAGLAQRRRKEETVRFALWESLHLSGQRIERLGQRPPLPLESGESTQRAHVPWMGPH